MTPRLYRARLLFEQGHFIEAEAELRTAISEGDDSSHAHALLALCLRNAGLHEEANTEIKIALSLNPNCAYTHYVSSFPSALTGQRITTVFLGPCVKHVLRALELEPNNVTYLSRLVQLRQNLHQWKQSLEPIEAALRLSPGDVSLVVQRAETLIHLGRRSEAHETLLLALQTDPEAASAHAGMGWALLRTGDYQRATEFFEEALRLRPELGWAQRGALECAKHQYSLYRLLVWPEQRLVHRPLLRFGMETGVCIVIVLAAFALLFWLDPIIRPRWGGGPIVVLILPLIILPIALTFWKEPFFSWLVRHHRAAQLSYTEPVVKENATKWTLGIVIVCLTILFALLLHYSQSAFVFGLLGLIPGLASLGVTIFDMPADTWRKWLVGFSSALLVAGPILMVEYREFILDLNPDPRSAIALILPAVFVALISNHIKQKHRVQLHKQRLAANSKKSLSK